MAMAPHAARSLGEEAHPSFTKKQAAALLIAKEIAKRENHSFGNSFKFIYCEIYECSV
ncbi:hypothetical protein ACFFHM_03865 [Halalkalibacter kiskunsagensis]|uniref:Uncharacterized protein n=1 Tax=Halalkalibacter kiskunsagensis TaxID=1548599 RepID=A0ABV6K8R1_9BACI